MTTSYHINVSPVLPGGGEGRACYVGDASMRMQHSARCFYHNIDAHRVVAAENRKYHVRHPHLEMQEKVAKYAAELRDVRLHKLTANAQKLFESLQTL